LLAWPERGELDLAALEQALLAVHAEPGDQIPEGGELLDLEEDAGQQVGQDRQLREPAGFLLGADGQADGSFQG
jgi:hypothetical protein